MVSNSELDYTFGWTCFYEEFADKLLAFRDNREELLSAIYGIDSGEQYLYYLNDDRDRRPFGERPLRDICPFTTMAIFNRKRKGLSDDIRKNIAQELANFLGVKIPAPDKFDGVHAIHGVKRIFFPNEDIRKPDDIDSLWEVFEKSLDFAKCSGDPIVRDSFIRSYNRASQVHGIAWSLTRGLSWIRPRVFQTLDTKSREYISETLEIPVSNHVKGNAESYLSLLDALTEKFQEPDCPVHSFQQLVVAAESGNSEIVFPFPVDPADKKTQSARTYTIGDILKDGCFLEHDRLSEILKRLEEKQNLILQGPPGTGKTWLAKRLAYALIGRQDADKVRSVQFHPNLSYEDFVRGYRPSSDGKLELEDGPFIEMIDAAKEDQSSRHVIVIEEINRGNPAQILGEMLTLLESDKRTPDEALELTYRKHEGERVYIPENLYVIGTMNMADRSLAMVDFALRRRFAFVNMGPELGEPWLGWVHEHSGIDRDALQQIKNKLDSLNETIADDPNLGPQFKIGHSFVTPTEQIPDADVWFRQVVETEIGPLLDEYWYDDREKAQEERNRLLSGI